MSIVNGKEFPSNSAGLKSARREFERVSILSEDLRKQRDGAVALLELWSKENTVKQL